MTKNEFLELLRDALSGQIPDLEIESNLKYYEEYIRTESQKTSEEMVLNMLGDPRLIAKTIIETYQLSHGPFYKNNNAHKAYYNEEKEYYSNYDSDKDDYDHNSKSNYSKGKGLNINISNSLTWIQKTILIAAIILLLIVIIFIGGILLNLAFIIGIPLLTAYIIYKIIKEALK